MPASRGRTHWVLTGLAAAAAFLLLRATPLPAGRESTFCLLRRWTGIPCPGCGLTRAFDRLADGDLLAAFVAHPLAPLLAVELLVGWLAWDLVLAGRLRLPAPRAVHGLLFTNLAALVALWLGRAATGTLPW